MQDQTTFSLLQIAMIVRNKKLRTPQASTIEKAQGKGLGQLVVSRKLHEQRPTAL